MCLSTRVIDLTTSNELQSLAFKIVKHHFTHTNQNLLRKPLFLLVKGIAGSGKSYVIDALRNLLQAKCRVLAYTGKAAYNVNGVTLHSLLKLPIGSKRNKDLKGIALSQLQDNLANVNYLIIGEYSFVGQSLFGWIDSRCRQATGKCDEPFGGLSIILFGDIAQLHPVVDKPLYQSTPKSEKQIGGLLMYQQFQKVITLTANERVKGCNQEQSHFRSLLARARNGDFTEDDWHTLLSRSPYNTKNINEFEQSAVKLSYYKETVAKLNAEKLMQLNEPIATINARHSKGAHKIHPDEFSGPEPVLYLSKHCRVMLSILVLEPLTFERLQAPKKSPNLQYRISDEKRLDLLSQRTLVKFKTDLGKQ